MYLIISYSVHAVNAVVPSLPCRLPLPEEIAEAQPCVFDNSKQDRILGLNFRSKSETTKDIIDDAVKRGYHKIANVA